MKKQTPLAKAIVVAVIVGILGYIGLDVPRGVIQDAVDTQFQKQASDEVTSDLDGSYVVMRVTDGDTLVLGMDTEEESIRLVGINTPETAFAPRGEECFGPEAAAYAKELLDGKKVVYTADPSQGLRDRHERLLGYVGLPDGSDFGEKMIREGYAFEYTYSKPYAKQELYKAAEQEAREMGRGVWSCAD